MAWGELQKQLTCPKPVQIIQSSVYSLRRASVTEGEGFDGFVNSERVINISDCAFTRDLNGWARIYFNLLLFGLQ